MLGFIQNHLKLLISTIVTVTLIVVFFFPQTHYKLGSVFFGEVPKLYNINLAQYFYLYSAYPLIGKAPEFSHYQLSRTYFIKGDLRTALKEAKKELELYPDNLRTYYILGLTLGYMHQEEKAIEAFSKFIEAYPNSWAARNDKAWLQFRVGDIEGALVTIEPVSNIVNPWIQNTYGTLLMNNGNYTEANNAFVLASEIVYQMTEESWGKAYPGNDPKIYEVGLQGMKNSINDNLQLVRDILYPQD